MKSAFDCVVILLDSPIIALSLLSSSKILADSKKTIADRTLTWLSREDCNTSKCTIMSKDDFSITSGWLVAFREILLVTTDSHNSPWKLRSDMNVIVGHSTKSFSKFFAQRDLLWPGWMSHSWHIAALMFKNIISYDTPYTVISNQGSIRIDLFYMTMLISLFSKVIHIERFLFV